MSDGQRQQRFSGLVSAHERILWKVAHLYGRNRADRDDLVQEMVVQLWRAFGRYDERFAFSTWMYRIAANVAISWLRSETRRMRDMVPMEELGGEPPAAERLFDGASDELEELLGLVRRLDGLSRALVLLHLDGYSHDEIAVTMGISAGNVATRLHRIRAQLQRTSRATKEEERAWTSKR
jgi:RNA polymerase sigma factor (sigma-70 family)